MPPSSPAIHRVSALPRWIWPVCVAAVLAVAALLRFWALGRPDTLVFDEIYYVRDAITQLVYGYPTDWPSDDDAVTSGYLSTASYPVHPPLGKWLIGLGILVFGPDSGWGWRSAVALTGVATVAVTMRLGWLLSRSMPIALVAGLLLAIDGVHVTLTRVGLLDGFLAFFIALGALWVWRDHEWVTRRSRTDSGFRVLLNRPWLVAAAVAFGAAAAVKWSGLYPLAGFLLLVCVRDLTVRLQFARAIGASRSAAWVQGIGQALATGLFTIPVTVAVYLASWAGWIVTSDGWNRGDGPWWQELWEYHVSMFEWHSTLSAPHPFQAHPLTWPLALRPTAMYEESVGAGLTEAISPLPNLPITWGGVLALGIIAWWIIRRLLRARSFAAAHTIPFAALFVLTGYLSGWLPWVLTLSRSAVFQFYAVVLTPFSALALALVIGAICGLGPLRHELRPVDGDELFGRRLAVAVFLGVSVILAVLFFPVWSGTPIPEWFWRWHLWLPGWD